MMVKIEIEMPDGCADCPFAEYGDIMDELHCRADVTIPTMSYDDFKETRHERCQLVEVED